MILRGRVWKYGDDVNTDVIFPGKYTYIPLTDPKEMAAHALEDLDPGFAVVWRNLGIGYFNVHRRPAKARAAYARAFRADPSDARIFYERDQLWKRLGESPRKRLDELE